ncbi:MAG: chromate transporter [Ruminococcaceae bacterium]|nr:chromate transporter [Oscillospiraceae bacterium]
MIYLDLFFTLFKIGAFTFGGGYAMLPLIQSEVLRKGWLSQKQIVDFIAVSESTPGPFAVNISTYVGSVKGGILGSFCATLGVVLPSFIIILIVARFYEKFKKSKTVEGVMSGLKPAVIGLIASAVISIGTTVFFANGFSLSVFSTKEFYISLLIFALSIVLVLKKLNPVFIIILSATLGILTGFLFGL